MYKDQATYTYVVRLLCSHLNMEDKSPQAVLRAVRMRFRITLHPRRRERRRNKRRKKIHYTITKISPLLVQEHCHHHATEDEEVVRVSPKMRKAGMNWMRKSASLLFPWTTLQAAVIMGSRLKVEIWVRITIIIIHYLMYLPPENWDGVELLSPLTNSINSRMNSRKLSIRMCLQGRSWPWDWTSVKPEYR